MTRRLLRPHAGLKLFLSIVAVALFSACGGTVTEPIATEAAPLTAPALCRQFYSTATGKCLAFDGLKTYTPGVGSRLTTLACDQTDWRQCWAAADYQTGTPTTTFSSTRNIRLDQPGFDLCLAITGVPSNIQGLGAGSLISDLETCASGQSVTLYPGEHGQFTATAQGSNYILDGSSGLVNWTPSVTNFHNGATQRTWIPVNFDMRYYAPGGGLVTLTSINDGSQQALAVRPLSGTTNQNWRWVYDGAAGSYDLVSMASNGTNNVGVVPNPQTLTSTWGLVPASNTTRIVTTYEEWIEDSFGEFNVGDMIANGNGDCWEVLASDPNHLLFPGSCANAASTTDGPNYQFSWQVAQ